MFVGKTKGMASVVILSAMGLAEYNKRGMAK
jgi:hypothetical protein